MADDDPDEWEIVETPWVPPNQSPSVPDVDWDAPEPIGIIELPDGTEIEVFEYKPAFGFGRWLEE